jgi:hypothetical protein
MRTALWFWLSALLLFAAGVAVGALVAPGRRPADTDGRAPPVVAPPAIAPPYLIASDEVFAELQLDDVQRQRFHDLLADHARGLRDLRRSMGELGRALREGVRQILTPAQLERFEAIQERYGEREIRARVERELDRLRVEIDLEPEQEPRVYQALYDTRVRKKELWETFQSRGGEDWPKCQAEMDALSSKEESLLIEEILSPAQVEKYRAYRERERDWAREQRRRHEGKRGRGPEPPDGPAPGAPGERAGADSPR